MENYQMLTIIGVCLGSVGLGVLIKYLTDRYKIKNSDLLEGISVAQTLLTFIKLMLKDMKFGNDDEVDKVTNVINDSLNYIKKLPEIKDKESKIFEATTFSIKMCKELEIELNDDRLYILNNTVTLAYNLIESIENKQIEEV